MSTPKIATASNLGSTGLFSTFALQRDGVVSFPAVPLLSRDGAQTNTADVKTVSSTTVESAEFADLLARRMRAVGNAAPANRQFTQTGARHPPNQSATPHERASQSAANLPRASEVPTLVGKGMMPLASTNNLGQALFAAPTAGEFASAHMVAGQLANPVLPLAPPPSLPNRPVPLSIHADTTSLAVADATIFLARIVLESSSANLIRAPIASEHGIVAATPAPTVSPPAQPVTAPPSAAAPAPIPVPMIVATQSTQVASAVPQTAAPDDVVVMALQQANLNAEMTANAQWISNNPDLSYFAAPFYMGLLIDRSSYNRTGNNHTRSGTSVPPIKPIIRTEWG